MGQRRNAFPHTTGRLLIRPLVATDFEARHAVFPRSGIGW